MANDKNENKGPRRLRQVAWVPARGITETLGHTIIVRTNDHVEAELDVYRRRGFEVESLSAGYAIHELSK